VGASCGNCGAHFDCIGLGAAADMVVNQEDKLMSTLGDYVNNDWFGFYLMLAIVFVFGFICLINFPITMAFCIICEITEPPHIG
jgi:hypothetical protein